MKKVLLLIAIVLPLLHAPLSGQSQPLDTVIIGKWLGTLDFGTAKLRIVFRILPDTGKGVTAFLDSPDQGAKDIPVPGVSFENDSLTLLIPLIGGSYGGRLDRTTMVMNGVWKQAGNEFPLDLEKTTEQTDLARPQEPKPPFPYEILEFSFFNEKDSVYLAATLTMPKTDKPVPAVVLVTGSGPQDRDESLVGHRPFWILADYLTRQGIAVLRYDDRGFGKSTGDFASATTIDFATDAGAAVSFLKTRKNIDASKIGIIGHSEGGIVAPLTAAGNPDVAYIVLIAGPAVTGKDIIMLQSELISRAEGGDETEIQKSLKFQSRLFSILESEPDSAKAHELLLADYRQYMDSLPDSLKSDETVSTQQRDQALKTINNPWFRFFLFYDPIPTLNQVRCPVLAIYGEKDLQVPPVQNAKVMEDALKAQGVAESKVVVLPGLNHLMQKTETGAISEYGKIEETINPSALQVISEWLLHVTR